MTLAEYMAGGEPLVVAYGMGVDSEVVDGCDGCEEAAA